MDKESSNNPAMALNFKITITGIHSGEVVEFNAYGWHVTTDNELVCTIQPEDFNNS